MRLTATNVVRFVLLLLDLNYSAISCESERCDGDEPTGVNRSDANGSELSLR